MKTANDNFETFSHEVEIDSSVKKKLLIKTDEPLFVV